MTSLHRLGRLFFALVLLTTVGAVTGCSDQNARPERPTTPEGPPPPTPEEIAGKAITELELDAPLPLRGATLPNVVRQNILDSFRSQNATLSTTPEGKAALRIVKKQLEKRVRAMERQELWEHVLAYSDAHAILDPGSKLFNNARDRAITELSKPRVTVRGLPEFDGHKYAMVSIYLPMESMTYDERMRVGEEMHGVKLLGIFGDDKGIRMEYSETGDRFVVYLPSAL